MRCHCRCNSAACLTVPGLGETNRLGKLGALLLFRAKPDHAAGQTCPYAGFFYDAGDFVHMIVHIHEGRRSALKHLEDGKHRARADFGGGKLRLHRPHILLQPDLKVHVVLQSAEQRHCGVPMRINKPGHK
jgi:hypothetical protein